MKILLVIATSNEIQQERFSNEILITGVGMMNTAVSLTQKLSSSAYDLVINGNEIGGGSIRIHDQKLQEEVFSILGFSKKEAFYSGHVLCTLK